MSSSDKSRLQRRALVYLGVSAFCGLFAAVYERFSHGVYSNYMILLFLWPLCGGALLLLPTAFPAAPCPSALSRDLWGSGVATLTLGSCLRGVFDIYGTASALVSVYWLAGALLLTHALFLYARRLFPQAFSGEGRP